MTVKQLNNRQLPPLPPSLPPSIHPSLTRSSRYMWRLLLIGEQAWDASMTFFIFNILWSMKGDVWHKRGCSKITSRSVLRASLPRIDYGFKGTVKLFVYLSLQRRILTLRHIVRLTMLLECGISTQKWPEIREKGQRRSPEIVSRFPKIDPSYLNIFPAFPKMFPGFPKFIMSENLLAVSWNCFPVSQKYCEEIAQS